MKAHGVKGRNQSEETGEGVDMPGVEENFKENVIKPRKIREICHIHE